MTAWISAQMTPSGDVPVLDAALVRECVRDLKAGSSALAQLSTRHIAHQLARVAALWLTPDSELLAETVREAAPRAGFSEPMLRWCLEDLLRRITAPALERLVESELGSVEPFQSPRERAGAVCARGAHNPELVFHVLAGTVPQVAIEVIVLALLARGPLLLKTSSEEPVVARAFLRSLRELAPELAAHVAVLTWRGGDETIEDELCRQASLVCAYGSNDAIDQLMRRCRFPTRFMGYGHLVSVGLIGPGLTPLRAPALADAFALDVAAFDQRGCMSPHCVFYSTENELAPEAFAAGLHASLATLEQTLPRGVVSPGVAAAHVQARGLGHFLGSVWEGATHTVVLHTDTVFQPSPSGRLVHVVPYRELSQVVDALRPLRGSLSTLGLEPGTLRPEATFPLVAALAFHRVTRPGRMQRPVLLRDHDGRPRLGDWVRWVNVEPS